MSHDRDRSFEVFAQGLRLRIPYCTRGAWEKSGLSGVNRLPLWRCFVATSQGDGESWIRSRVPGKYGERLALTVGTVVLIPSGIDLEFHFAPSSALVAIHFSAESAPGRPLFHGQGIRSQALPDWLMEAPIQSLHGMSLLGWWHGVLAACVHQPLPSVSAFWLPLMHVEPTADLRVSDVASLLGLSANAVSKRFQREFACSLKGWLDGRLTEAASGLLLADQQPVKAVADHLRFSTEFHFSRFFKRRTGLSPSAFRQQAGLTVGGGALPARFE